MRRATTTADFTGLIKVEHDVKKIKLQFVRVFFDETIIEAIMSWGFPTITVPNCLGDFVQGEWGCEEVASSGVRVLRPWQAIVGLYVMGSLNFV